MDEAIRPELFDDADEFCWRGGKIEETIPAGPFFFIEFVEQLAQLDISLGISEI